MLNWYRISMCFTCFLCQFVSLSSDVSGCMLSLNGYFHLMYPGVCCHWNGYFHLMYQGVCCHWTATFVWCIRVYVVIELLLSSDVSGCMLSLNCYFRLMYQGVCCHWTTTFIWCIRVYVVIKQNCYFHLMYQGVCCQLLLSSDVSGCMLALNCCFCLMYQGVCWHWTAAFIWCIRVYT